MVSVLTPASRATSPARRIPVVITPDLTRAGPSVLGPVVPDLEAQEVVDRPPRLTIRRVDRDLAAAIRGFVAIADRVPQPRHRGSARRNPSVDEHRHREIAGGEGLRDVLEMFARLVATRVVGRVRRFEPDHAAPARD